MAFNTADELHYRLHDCPATTEQPQFESRYKSEKSHQSSSDREREREREGRPGIDFAGPLTSPSRPPTSSPSQILAGAAVLVAFPSRYRPNVPHLLGTHLEIFSS